MSATTKPLTEDPAFTEGHANFPRFGWTAFGLGLAAALSAVGGTASILGVFGAYAIVWTVWGAFLLGRREGRSRGEL